MTNSIAVFCGSAFGTDEIFNQTAQDVGRAIAEQGKTLVYGGGKSGLMGVSGISSDARDIDAAVKEGNQRADLARRMFIYRVKKYIGAYAAAMNGVDVLVFTGGIGENDTYIRGEIIKGLTYLGIEFDESKNAVRGEEAILSAPNSKVTVCVIPTDEEWMIASDTQSLI